MIRKGNPLPRVPGGEFEQFVEVLKRERRLKEQRQHFGIGASAVLFVRSPRPAPKPKRKQPMPLLFSSGSKGC